MDHNRAAMLGRQAEMHKQQSSYRLRAKGLLQQMAITINPALQNIEEMDIAMAASLMDDLVMIQAELLSLQSKISQLEEALYG